jgi:hypothetical protein
VISSAHRGEKFSSAVLGALAAVGIVLAIYARSNENIAHHDDRDAGPALGPSSQPPEVLVDTHAAEIAALRKQAEEAAASKQWQECSKRFYDIWKLRGPSDAAEDPLEQTCDEEFARLMNVKSGGGTKTK